MTVEIRLARPADAGLLPGIELSAARRFAGSAQAAVVDHPVTPASWYGPHIAAGLVWVADGDDGPLGFANIEPFADALHLWELAVRLDAQGRGAGTALVRAVADDARARGLPAVTLTTFRDIPWNAPFYASLGFVEVPQDATWPRLSGLRGLELSRGLDIEARCAMRLEV